jgi:hypothetical protein
MVLSIYKEAEKARGCPIQAPSRLATRLTVARTEYCRHRLSPSSRHADNRRVHRFILHGALCGASESISRMPDGVTHVPRILVTGVRAVESQTARNTLAVNVHIHFCLSSR